jgi:hypothetical protein
MFGCAESIHQSNDEGGGLRDGGRRGRRLTEGDRFRSMLRRDTPHCGGDLVERRIP